MAKPSDILTSMAIADKDSTDSARVAGYLDMFRNAQGLTGDLREKAFIEGFGGSVPYEFREAETKAELPTISAILDKLELKDDKKDMKGGKTALDKFLSGMTDRKKRADFKDSIEKAWGPEGWKWTQKAFQDVSTDKMNEDIRAGRIMALEGEAEGQGIPEKVGGMALQFFRPRAFEAYAEGREPGWKDELGDAIESGFMAIPAAGYAGGASKIIGKIAPRVVNYASKVPATKAVANVFGNSFAPIASEAMDDVMRGEDDPNTTRQDFSVGDAMLGAATNIGINHYFYPLMARAGRFAMNQLSRSAGGGASAAAREVIENLGESRAARGLGPALPESISKRIGAKPSAILNKSLDVASMSSPTLLVNRMGKDKHAEMAVNGLGGFASGIIGDGRVNLFNDLKELRDKEHGEMKDRKTKNEVEAVKGTTLGLTPRDEKYLQAVADDPSIVQFGFAENPDDFKLWLLERGHDLLKGTGAHRPLWEIEAN